MAFHDDDVDDANDANEKTSSEQEFELPFPRRAASSAPIAQSSSGGDESETEIVDLSEASNDGVPHLDTALNIPNILEPDAPADLPPPPASDSDFAPSEVNDEFQRSDLSDGLDQEIPPWASAPAPDPSQAVSQLEAPDGLSNEQRAAAANVEDADTATSSGGSIDPGAAGAPVATDPSVNYFAPKSASSAIDDPYQIPVDYTTPDFFASRISGRRPLADGTEVSPGFTPDPDAESGVDGNESVQQPNESTDSAEPEDDSDFNFDSLFATEEPSIGAEAPTPTSDTSRAQVPPSMDSFSAVPGEDSVTTNNVWKLGPLEPNALIADAKSADEGVGAEQKPDTDEAVNSDETVNVDGASHRVDEVSPEPPLADEKVIEGAPMWNLDGVDASDFDAMQSATPEPQVERSLPGEFPADAFSAAAAEFAPQHEDDLTLDEQMPSVEIPAEPEAFIETDLPVSLGAFVDTGSSIVPDVSEPMDSFVAESVTSSEVSEPFGTGAPLEDTDAVTPTGSGSFADVVAPDDLTPNESEIHGDSALSPDADAPAEVPQEVPFAEARKPTDAPEPSQVSASIDASEPVEGPEPAVVTGWAETPVATDDSPPAVTTELADAAEPLVEREVSGRDQAAELVEEPENPTPPVRRSMPDDELLTWVDNPENQSTGTLSVIEVLEAQLRLREEEALEYREWETTLRSKSRPEVDQVIEQAGLEPSDTASSDDDATAPTPTQQAAAESPTTPPAAQLPAWDVPPPSDNWAPGDDFEDEIPFAAHADPTGAITIPVLDDETAESVRVGDRSTAEPISSRTTQIQDFAEDDTSEFAEFATAPSESAEEPAPEIEPASALASAEEPTPTPAPEPVREPEPEPEPEPAPASASASASAPIVPQFDAESGLLSLSDVPPLPVSEIPSADNVQRVPPPHQIEHSPEFPADEDGDYDEIPFTPPALVEPITAPSTPRSNLDEHVSFGDFGFTPPISGEPEEASDPRTDAAPVEPASDADEEAPFVFDLDSPSASVPTIDAELDSSGADSAGTETETETTNTNTDTDTDNTDRELEAADDVVASPDIESDAAPAAFSFASQETPRYVPTVPLSFDDLLKTDDLEDVDEAPETDEVNPLDIFISEPEGNLPQQGDPLSEVQTGSVSITEAVLEAEGESDEAVDASDRSTNSAGLSSSLAALDSNPIPFAAGATAGTTDAVAAASPGVGSSEIVMAAPLVTDSSPVPQPMPLSTARVSQQPLGLGDVAPTAQPVFSLEESGLEPTPIDRRIGHAARMFWLWFAANSSIVSIGLGAAVFAVGMSLRQSVVAILAGIALSFIPLGLTTLAGKRSGQPTMVISRSTFGLLGNVIPSVVALVARLFWGAVLLWVLASSVAIVLIGSDLNSGLGDRQLLLIALALSFLVALVIAFAGYPLFARIQLILSVISGVLVIGLIAFTAQYIDLAQALITPDGSWLLTLTGAVLVFSFLGLVWAYSGADIARYQRPSSSGAASALSAAFGATLPAFVLIAYGALLAASDPAIARGFLTSPLDTLLLLLPGWYPIPLLLAAALSLLSGITLSLYSGGFALQAIGVRIPRQWSIVIVGVLLGGLAILFAFGISGGINELFRDVATTLAVPTAAWVGIFAAETMIRTRRLDSAALTTRGGIYADVRWVNLSAFIVISAIGFALTSATIGWLSWQGYGFVALGIDLGSELAATDLGVFIALILGMLTPIVAGIPAIRRQEAGSSEWAARRA